MLHRRHKRALAIMALTLAACQSPAPTLSPPAQAVTLRLRATQSTMHLLRDLTRGYQAMRPDLRVLAHITEIQYQDALLPAFEEDGHYVLVDYLPPDSSRWAIPVARDQIAIISGPDTATNAITLPELRAVLTGQITDWAELGGPDLPVTVISRESGSAPRRAMHDLVLGGLPVTRNARLATSQAAMLRIVRETPGAIGHVAYSALTASAPTPLLLDGYLPSDAPTAPYPLETTLYVIGPGEPDGTLRDFLAWVQSDAGQEIVSQRYLSTFVE